MVQAEHGFQGLAFCGACGGLVGVCRESPSKQQGVHVNLESSNHCFMTLEACP